MKIDTNRVLFILILVLIIGSVFWDYNISRQVAIRYTEILTIHDQESFEKVKKDIFQISPKNVQEGLFSSETYNLEDSVPINYKIKELNLVEIKNFSHYIFLIRYQVIGWKEAESLVYIKNRKVYNVHRKE